MLIKSLLLTNSRITIFKKNTAVFTALLPACHALEREREMEGKHALPSALPDI